MATARALIMQIKTTKPRQPWLLALWLGLGTGCESPTGVEGLVTYNGQPVSRGILSVTPAEGRGKGEGGRILNGAYRIAPISTGRKKFSVRGELGAVEEVSPATSETKAEALAARESQTVLQIPPRAIGNGQFYEIVPGQQTFNIELTDPQ